MIVSGACVLTIQRAYIHNDTIRGGTSSLWGESIHLWGKERNTTKATQKVYIDM